MCVCARKQKKGRRVMRALMNGVRKRVMACTADGVHKRVMACGDEWRALMMNGVR